MLSTRPWSASTKLPLVASRISSVSASSMCARNGARRNFTANSLTLPNGNVLVTMKPMMLKLEEYVREDGSNPYQTWFDGLDSQAAAKIAVAKARIELGNTSAVKWFRGIGEYVIDWGPGYRIYLAKDGDALIILFGGSTKKGQQKAIDQAVALHDEYKARKKALAASRKGKRT